MSITAMKQMLEALERGLEYAKGEQFENAQKFKGYEHLAPNDADSVKLIEAAITAGRQAIEQAQEPVAWMQKENYIDDNNLWDEQVTFNQKGNGIPLYTTPQPQQEKRESLPVCEYCEKERPVIHAPKREWVGLTPDELTAISDSMRTWNSFSIQHVYTAIEAKLKEKNNG